MTTTNRWVLLPAGGTGTRMGLPYPKQLLPYRGRPLILHVLDKFAGERVVVAVPAAHRAAFEAVLPRDVRMVEGGDTRYASVRRAFEAVNPEDADLVLIHDVARPFLDPADLPDAWRLAADKGAIIFAAQATDTIKAVDAEGRITKTHDRTYIYQAQTPQIFRAGLLRAAYAAHDRGTGPAPTDEAALVEWSGTPVFVRPTSPANRKLTHKEDLALLQSSPLRIGHGYDVHRYDPDRPLYLGGVLIPDEAGLLGHSDADVVLHALIDALLGAAGLGDIGTHFPDTAAEFKDIRSTVLLDRVLTDLRGRGYQVVNADITIQAQVPRLARHIPAMRAAVAEALAADVNIKATTTEKLGFVGRAEGMAAHAVVLLQQGEQA